tara:strand:- start:188 stop:349 length:162 start_codon:yes stop_codon:yes gene_type:complete
MSRLHRDPLIPPAAASSAHAHRGSLLCAGAGARLLIAGLAAALLWLCVIWALT